MMPIMRSLSASQPVTDRHVLCLSLLAVVAMLVAAHRYFVAQPAADLHTASTSFVRDSALTDMQRFTDPVAGFEARVPSHWQRNFLPSDAEPGVTVTFESPLSDEADRFSDYLMIDIQPGHTLMGVDLPSDERAAMRVANQNVFRERIPMHDYPVADTRLDLVTWQIVLRRPGYSIGMYVVGEQHESAYLERILIEFAYSFEMPAPPFMMAQTYSPVGTSQRSG